VGRIRAEAEPRNNTNRSRAAQAAESGGGIIKLSFGRLAPPRFCFDNSTTFTETVPRDNTNRSRAAQAAELNGGIIKLSFGRLAPPRFCFGNSIVMPDLIRHPEKLDTGSEAGMTKASSTEAQPRDNTNRSRAAQAAESGGGIIKLSFGRLAPPRFCFGNSIVMPDLIRHPVHLAPRLTHRHSEPKPLSF